MCESYNELSMGVGFLLGVAFTLVTIKLTAMWWNR